MVGLTPKQKEELNQAIYEYLVKNKYAQAASSFIQDTGIATDDPNSRGLKDILENKWTAVVKLKKQVIELEKQNK